MLYEKTGWLHPLNSIAGSERLALSHPGFPQRELQIRMRMHGYPLPTARLVKRITNIRMTLPSFADVCHSHKLSQSAWTATVYQMWWWFQNKLPSLKRSKRKSIMTSTTWNKYQWNRHSHFSNRHKQTAQSYNWVVSTWQGCQTNYLLTKH